MDYSRPEPAELSAFRRKACIDWLALTLRTAQPTQFQHIQAALEDAGAGRRSVTPLDPGPGGVASTFRVRFHDELANDYAGLCRTLAEVSERFPVAVSPDIDAIEIACDFMHTGDPAERDERTKAMTHRLQMSLLAGGTSPRQFDPALGERGSNRFMDRPGQRLNPDLNYRIGNKRIRNRPADDVAWQVYWKTTDCKRQLPPAQWRARVEVTLRGTELKSVGLAKLSDLDGYRFASLARFFRFRTPIDPEVQASGDRYKLISILTNRRLNDATPERGVHSFAPVGRRDRYRKLRKESSHLQADSDLQDAVKGALRRLTL